tara:strand:- start:286 stop:732 length:447 start_codon:yes stop_codon:yes gene_type:complete
LNSSRKLKPSDFSRRDYTYWQQVSTRWVDNDVYGHINNAVYFSYIDSVVNQFLIEYQLLDLEKSEVIGVVAQSQCRFFQSLSYPGVVDCGLRVRHLGKTSVSYEVGMFEQDKEAVAAVGGFTHVFVDRSQHRPRPLSELMRSAFSTLA